MRFPAPASTRSIGQDRHARAVGRNVAVIGTTARALVIGAALLAAQAGVAPRAARAQGPAPVAEFISEIRSGPSGSLPIDFAVFGDALYFSANDGVNGDELWRLDANNSATLVADIFPGTCDQFGVIAPCSSGPRQLTVAGDRLYFVAGTAAENRELWQYDGINPPSLAADIWPGTTTSFILFLTAFGNEVVFRANDGTGDELFRYNPVAGLRRFDIWRDDPSCDPANGGCGSYPYGLTVYQGVLYFGATDEVFGTELHQYNGSDVTILTDIIGGLSPSDPEQMTGIGNLLVFSAYAGFSFPKELYSYNIGTREPRVIPTGTGNGFLGSQPSTFTSFNGRAYFQASDVATGRELWSTDGTEAGTFLVQDINPGTGSSDPRNYASFNGELYFSAFDPVAGNEIRATDGTNVRLLADLNPGTGSSSFDGPAVLGNFLIFQGQGANFRLHPWFTDGTAGRTDIVRQADGTLIHPTGDSVDDPDFTFFNGSLYVHARDNVRGGELWRVTLTARTPTTTTLVSSLNPSKLGEQVTFTATVTGASPTGTVTFLDNTTPLATLPLVSGAARLDITTLGVGSHTITASYSGDADDAPSMSSPLVQVVDPASTTATTTTLTSSLNPSDFGQGVTFTATVTDGSPTGTVTFFDGGTTLDVVPLAGNTASYTAPNLSGGSHPITARYNGDADHSPSTSNVVLQVVNRLATTTTLTAAPNPSLVGRTVEFTAVMGPGLALSGTVTFVEGAVTHGVVPFNGNTASLQISTLTAGAHTIRAIYSGDNDHDGSTSNDVIQVVNQGATLIVVKQVINDNGGTAAPADFTMSVIGNTPSPASFPGSAAGTAVTINAGGYSVTEVNLPSYAATAGVGCGGTIAEGETKTCIFTNDDRPTTLQLTKFVNNDNGGGALPSDWTLTANGQPFTSGVPTPVAPGQFTLAESGGPSGYTAGSWSCFGGALAGNVVTVPPNVPVQCSIINDDQQASLTLTKIVVNDSGGNATPANWTLTANLQPFVSGVSQPVNAGVYALAESGGQGGYVPSAWSCAGGALAGSALTLLPGQTASCSITNDDQGATLTVIKRVVNDNGGTRQSSDFTITVAGTSPVPASFPGNDAGTIVSIAAGPYSVTESGGAGYSGTFSADCAGTLAIGESKTCTMTNDDRQATLTLTKLVINNSGGAAPPTAWTLTANGTPFPSGVAQPVPAGDYVLAESIGPPGYAAGGWVCTGGTLAGNTVTVGPGATVSCTITNDDQPARLMLTKIVVNDNGGTAAPSDWALSASGILFPSGVSQSISAGTYTLAESIGPAGYTAGVWTCVGGILAGTSLTLGLGEQAVCSITNDDQAGRLTVIKTAINDDGGGAAAGDFTITVTGNAPSPAMFPGNAAGTVVILNAGAYSVGASGPAGYATSMTIDCVGTIALGEIRTCTITSNDQSANTPPVAQNQSVTTPEDTPVGIVLIATDAENDPLTYAIVTGPANGSLSGAGPNRTYTPNPGYYGPDNFTFRARDGQTDSNVATVSITVTPVRADVAVTIVDAPDPAVVGQPLSYTIQVANLGPALAPATTVTVILPLGVALIGAPGTCSGATTLSCPQGTLAPGDVRMFVVQVAPQNAGSIAATASADSTAPDPVPANNSATADTTVHRAPTSITLTSSLSPSTFGQPVTFTATVSGFGPSGMVTFSDGATVLGTATLTGGVATLTAPALPAGTRSIVATYAGDANNLPSTSNTLAQIVQPAPTTTAVISSLNPSTPGQSITFTATVTGPAPTGTVSFFDGGTLLGSATLVGGSASLTINLGVGQHPITAAYGGDANHAPSTSTALAETVNNPQGKTTTVTTLVSSVNPSAVGQPVTFTATVAGANPTGTVTFTDVNDILGTAQLVNGVATLTVPGFSKGAHQISASYAGDDNNLPSTSTKLKQQAH